MQEYDAKLLPCSGLQLTAMMMGVKEEEYEGEEIATVRGVGPGNDTMLRLTPD
jgi:hypothetical protein